MQELVRPYWKQTVRSKESLFRVWVCMWTEVTKAANYETLSGIMVVVEVEQKQKETANSVCSICTQMSHQRGGAKHFPIRVPQNAHDTIFGEEEENEQHRCNVTLSLDTLARGRQIAETVSSIHQLRKKSNRGRRRLMIEISHIRSD